MSHFWAVAEESLQNFDWLNIAAQLGGILASHLAAPGSILGLGLEIYRQRCCLEMWTAEA